MLSGPSQRVLRVTGICQFSHRNFRISLRRAAGGMQGPFAILMRSIYKRAALARVRVSKLSASQGALSLEIRAGIRTRVAIYLTTCHDSELQCLRKGSSMVNFKFARSRASLRLASTWP